MSPNCNSIHFIYFLSKPTIPYHFLTYPTFCFHLLTLPYPTLPHPSLTYNYLPHLTPPLVSHNSLPWQENIFLSTLPFPFLTSAYLNFTTPTLSYRTLLTLYIPTLPNLSFLHVLTSYPKTLNFRYPALFANCTSFHLSLARFTLIYSYIPTFLFYISLKNQILTQVGNYFRGSALWPEGPLRSSDTFFTIGSSFGKTNIISAAPSIEWTCQYLGIQYLYEIW